MEENRVRWAAAEERGRRGAETRFAVEAVEAKGAAEAEAVAATEVSVVVEVAEAAAALALAKEEADGALARRSSP